MRLFVMRLLQELAAVGGSCRNRGYTLDADGSGQQQKKKKEEEKKNGRRFGALRIFG